MAVESKRIGPNRYRESFGRHLEDFRVANLGRDRVRLAAPVFVGDTIYAESEVLEVRESGSRPAQGIVTVRTTGKKADGTVFMTCERSFLVPKRGHAVDDAADY